MRKAKGCEPIEYSKGFCRFLGCKIDLSFKPMIPRLETEFWVKKAIQDINLPRAKSREKIDVLDIFAGSGCIGIAVLKNCPEQCRRAVFSEIDKNLIKQIKINLKINKINPTCPEQGRGKRYKVIQSDIFKRIKGKYDYIFANPPYVATSRKYLVQNSVLDFEPQTAIFAGNDGLFYIKRFLKEAKKHLKNYGKIYLEFDHFHKGELEKILPKSGYKNFKFFKDQFKKWRWAEIST